MNTRRGRPTDPNALKFQSIGLRPDKREYLRLWRLNPDQPAPEPGSEADNPTQQLELLIERAMEFWPGGPGDHWPRDERGRFTKHPKDDN
jgi:hypothetical protein